MTATTESAGASAIHRPTQARRATAAGFVGTAIEYYDLYIYASASALVFSTVFFPAGGSGGLLLALASFGVAYLARPLGAVLAGHFGDRLGRRNVLLVILLVMGFATFAIGCLPSYDTIGIWAPILLVTFRIAQGLSAGGELTSSTALTAEHAPRGSRGFYTALSYSGSTFGYLLATIAFLGVAALPEGEMLSWGWRIPFLSSLVIVIIGLYVRWWIHEPEAFLEEKRRSGVSKVPLLDVLREQPGDFVRVVLITLQIVVTAIVPVYGLTYATNVAKVPSSAMLNVVAASYVVALVFHLAGGFLSDKFGRKPILIVANTLAGIAVWPYFWSVGQGNITFIYAWIFLSYSIPWGLIGGVYPVFYIELFSTRYRVSGVAVASQIGLILVGFSPFVAELLTMANAGAWWPAALVSATCSAIAIFAIGNTRETYRGHLSENDDRENAIFSDRSARHRDI